MHPRRHETYQIHLVVDRVPPTPPSRCHYASDVSISLFQFRYDIDAILTKYRDIDINVYI